MRDTAWRRVHGLEVPIPAATPPAKVDITVVIAAPPARVLRAFFDRGALGAWWEVAAAVTTPRVLGPYVVEWKTTDVRDEILGRLGGVLRGTVVQIDSGGFFLAEVYWLPPDGDPVGPMAVEVTCTPETVDRHGATIEGTLLHVVQTGFEESPRWRQFYVVFGSVWERSLATLRGLLEP